MCKGYFKVKEILQAEIVIVEFNLKKKNRKNYMSPSISTWHKKFYFTVNYFERET